MKSIVPVNTIIPGLGEFLEYDSGGSLKDYDIILFDPKMPYYYRETFGGGGSCITIDGSQTFVKSSKHWENELHDAMKDGKTIFFILNESETDLAASGYTSAKNTRTYQTFSVRSYDVLPLDIKPHNASGSKIKVNDHRFQGLYDAIQKYMTYKVSIPEIGSKGCFTTKDGNTALGMVQKYKGMNGHIVFLPYFNLGDLHKTNAKGEQRWTNEGMGTGTKLIQQMIEIDKVLRKQSSATPAPNWISTVKKPRLLDDIKKKVTATESSITRAQSKRDKLVAELEDAETYQALLYETGSVLEEAVDRALYDLGYDATNFRKGSLEIDHVIKSPEGIRLIGETEGKDNSAIDVSKFRQLESNIGEDLEREDVTEPARGILFGNGYRLIDPTLRDVQFTDKCQLNAKRLGTALIQTSDLYPVVIYLQDNPLNDKYRTICRKAIENSPGKLVKFPAVPNENG